MENKLWKAFAAGLYTDEESVFYALMTEEQHCVLNISLIEGVGVGLVWTYPEHYNIKGEHIGIYVHPEKRRQGFGTKLVEMLGGVQDRSWLIGEDGSGEFWISTEEE